jgi:hypothetical protein
MDAFKIVKYGVFISVCDTKPVLSGLVRSASRVYPSHTHTLLHWADRKIAGCQLAYRV